MVRVEPPIIDEIPTTISRCKKCVDQWYHRCYNSPKDIIHKFKCGDFSAPLIQQFLTNMNGHWCAIGVYKNDTDYKESVAYITFKHGIKNGPFYYKDKYNEIFGNYKNDKLHGEVIYCRKTILWESPITTIVGIINYNNDDAINQVNINDDVSIYVNSKLDDILSFFHMIKDMNVKYYYDNELVLPNIRL